MYTAAILKIQTLLKWPPKVCIKYLRGNMFQKPYKKGGYCRFACHLTCIKLLNHFVLNGVKKGGRCYHCRDGVTERVGVRPSQLIYMATNSTSASSLVRACLNGNTRGRQKTERMALDIHRIKKNYFLLYIQPLLYVFHSFFFIIDTINLPVNSFCCNNNIGSRKLLSISL